MSTCATCTHWKHPRDGFGDAVRTDYDYGKDFTERQEEQRSMDVQYGDCDGISMPPERARGDLTMPLAVVMDGSDYKALLMTLPTFGCALWEQKP